MSIFNKSTDIFEDFISELEISVLGEVTGGVGIGGGRWPDPQPIPKKILERLQIQVTIWRLQRG